MKYAIILALLVVAVVSLSPIKIFEKTEDYTIPNHSVLPKSDEDPVTPITEVSNLLENVKVPDAPVAETGKMKFVENFSEDFILEECGQMNESDNNDWWVNSGAYLFSEDGIGRTIFGELEKDSKWQKRFFDYNAEETDGGYHPQNIFRLVTRTKWQNYQQEARFRIKRYIESKDYHRSESNGLLLFNRYQDGDNLYYAGLRVDGTAVIKKKIGGKYFTMAQGPIVAGDYSRESNPNLLPVDKWMSVKTELETVNKNQVDIKLYYRLSDKQEWKLALKTLDDGTRFGGAAILAKGYAGIRTDFMDVQFDDYSIAEK